MGYTFVYEKSALFYLRTPDNFKEFFIQTSRFHTEKDPLAEYFGKDFRKEYEIPFPYKFAQILFTTIRHPINTTLAFAMFGYFLYFYKKRDPLQQNGMWEVIKSSKKPIYLQTFQDLPIGMKPTVSVGISVYNEEQNIRRLLQQVVAQNTDTFILEHIYVNNDGSNDKTSEEVAIVQKDNPEVILMSDGKRKGKASRLMEIYQKNESDYLVIFDGDIKLGTDFTIEELIKPFRDPNVAITGANSLPAPSTTFTEYLINVWTWVWHGVRTHYKGGCNIHSLAGCGMALRRGFAKTITFPKGVISEAPFLYLSAVSQNLKFFYSERSIVFYASAVNLADFVKQRGRTTNELDIFHKQFGDIVEKESYIPRNIKLAGALRGLLKYNVMFILAFCLQEIAMMQVRNQKKTSTDGIWERVKSTKRTLAAGEAMLLSHKIYHIIHVMSRHGKLG